MANEMNSNDPIALWQDQKPERPAPGMDEIRRKAAEFENGIRSKQRRDINVGLLVIIVFALGITQGLVRGGAPWRLTSPALLIVGTLYVMSQIQRRAAFGSLPVEASAETFITYHRQELERQRHLLQTRWRWYFLPFVPGFAAGFIVAAIAGGMNAKLIGLLALFTLVVASGWSRNLRSIQQVDRRLDELKAAEH